MGGFRGSRRARDVHLFPTPLRRQAAPCHRRRAEAAARRHDAVADRILVPVRQWLARREIPRRSPGGQGRRSEGGGPLARNGHWLRRMTIRQPPARLPAPEYADMRRGTVLHRVHLTTYRAAEFNPGLGGPMRFAPFNDSTGTVVPSLYASTTLRAAVHETIFHDIPEDAATKTVRLKEVHGRTHSEIENVRDQRLVALRNPTLGRWGISRNELISSSPAQYGQTVCGRKQSTDTFRRPTVSTGLPTSATPTAPVSSLATV